MVVYEVTIEVAPASVDEYREWLRAHVEAICALPGFTGASTFEVLEPAAEDGWVTLCVQYRLVDPAALATYLRDHAPRMRAEGVARFGDRMRARRRVMHEAR